MNNNERTIENMSLMEVKDMMRSKPGMFRKTPKSHTDDERLELEKRGLTPLYDYFGRHADVICSRVETTLGLYAASEGLEPYSREIIDKVILLWAEGLKKGEVLPIIDLLDQIES